jgi:hypothetical protein
MVDGQALNQIIYIIKIKTFEDFGGSFVKRNLGDQYRTQMKCGQFSDTVCIIG